MQQIHKFVHVALVAQLNVIASVSGTEGSRFEYHQGVKVKFWALKIAMLFV
jgi:hypothetical protein